MPASCGLRPVMITVLALVFALIPLAMHGGPLWEPMCYAQMGGMMVATFITLLLVPVIYSIFVLDLKLIKWDTKGAETRRRGADGRARNGRAGNGRLMDASRRQRAYERYMETTATQAWITLSRAKTRGLRLALPLMCAWLALCLFLAVAPAHGQQMIQGRDETPSKSESEPTRLRTQLAEATREYKANLEKLVAIYEADAKRAEGRLQKLKELCAQGLITRREMETSEDAAARARDKSLTRRRS